MSMFSSTIRQIANVVTIEDEILDILAATDEALSCAEIGARMKNPPDRETLSRTVYQMTQAEQLDRVGDMPAPPGTARKSVAVYRPGKKAEQDAEKDSSDVQPPLAEEAQPVEETSAREAIRKAIAGIRREVAISRAELIERCDGSHHASTLQERIKNEAKTGTFLGAIGATKSRRYFDIATLSDDGAAPVHAPAAPVAAEETPVATEKATAKERESLTAREAIRKAISGITRDSAVSQDELFALIPPIYTRGTLRTYLHREQVAGEYVAAFGATSRRRYYDPTATEQLAPGNASETPPLEAGIAIPGTVSEAIPCVPEGTELHSTQKARYCMHEDGRLLIDAGDRTIVLNRTKPAACSASLVVSSERSRHGQTKKPH